MSELTTEELEEFLHTYCKEGVIDWESLIAHVSGNYDLDRVSC